MAWVWAGYPRVWKKQHTKKKIEIESRGKKRVTENDARENRIIMRILFVLVLATGTI